MDKTTLGFYLKCVKDRRVNQVIELVQLPIGADSLLRNKV